MPNVHEPDLGAGINVSPSKKILQKQLKANKKHCSKLSVWAPIESCAPGKFYAQETSAVLCPGIDLSSQAKRRGPLSLGLLLYPVGRAQGSETPAVHSETKVSPQPGPLLRDTQSLPV